MAELLKFRCSACAKLLGISPRKAGREIQCPHCGTELIVPSPDDDLATDDQDSADFADLGIDLGYSSELGIQPVERASVASTERPPNEAEAFAYLGQIAEPDLIEPEPNLTDFAGTDASDVSADDETDEEPLVATTPEPLVPRTHRPRARAPELDRRRDVNLPRTAVILWAMFALFSLAFSFVAGLMIGHYRWR